jgi:hypothetical protein
MDGYNIRQRLKQFYPLNLGDLWRIFAKPRATKVAKKQGISCVSDWRSSSFPKPGVPTGFERSPDEAVFIRRQHFSGKEKDTCRGRQVSAPLAIQRIKAGEIILSAAVGQKVLPSYYLARSYENTVLAPQNHKFLNIDKLQK